jgi:hypothetical protein
MRSSIKEFTETPVRLILGKSLVGGTPTGDVFEGITPASVTYVAAPGYQLPQKQVTVELGALGLFYRAFWRAHTLEHLADSYAPEAQVAFDETLWVPLLIRNYTDAPKKITLRAVLPAGWSQKPAPQTCAVEPHDSYSLHLTVISSESATNTWQKLTWVASGDGREIGTITLRGDGNGLPQ